MFLHRFALFFRALGFGLQHTKNTIRIPHGGDFRVRHHNRLIGKIQRKQRALFDAGGAVTQDVIEFFREFLDDLGDPFLGQRILVLGLGRRQDGERLNALVADQRLAQPRFALNDIDDVKDHAPFDTHNEVKVAQAHIEINHHRLLAALRKASCEGSA